MKYFLGALILFLLAVSSTAQEGVPVKSLNGAGAPNANMAHVVGTEYIDISTNPPVLYVCTAVTLTSTLSQCTWTASGGGSPGGANTQVQYNNNGAFAGASGLVTNGTTVGFDGAATITSAPPTVAGTGLGWKFCFYQNSYCQGVSNAQEVHITGGWLSVFGSAAQIAGNAGATPDTGAGASLGITGIYGKTYNTNTNCSSSASPAVCGSAAAGSVVIAAAATTVQVNTTAVTANSQILLTRDDTLGTKLSVTCNTATVMGEMKVSARSAGTSFTITVQTTPATNPGCVSYSIVN